MATTRTVVFTTPSANVRPAAAVRTKRIKVHFQHTKYVHLRSVNAPYRGH